MSTISLDSTETVGMTVFGALISDTPLVRRLRTPPQLVSVQAFDVDLIE